MPRKTLLGDDPHGYAAADAANDHLFYHGNNGYDDDNDDDYYDDDDSEWANSYNFCDITDADINDHPQEFVTENSSDTADPKNESTNNNDLSDDDNKKDYSDNDEDVDCFPWQDKQLVLLQDLSLIVPIAIDALPK